MKKRQLIATLSCLLVGMVGFAGAYALDQSAEIEEQQEAEASSSELLSQASGIVEPETDQDSEETGGESQETGSSLAKTDGAAEGSEGSSDTISTAADPVAEASGSGDSADSANSTNEENSGDGEDADGKDTDGEDSAAETAADSNALHFAAELRWPLDEGSVILDYSMDHMIYFPTLEQYQYNPAMIISASVGDKVYIAAEGTITDISTNEVTGLTVTEDLGDGYTAVYGQLTDLNFEVGDTVERGHVLGYVAEPTKYYSVEGTNLYFAIELDGEAVSPLEFLEE